MINDVPSSGVLSVFLSHLVTTPYLHKTDGIDEVAAGRRKYLTGVVKPGVHLRLPHAVSKEKQLF